MSSNVIIHKPKGKTVSKDTIELLYKKFGNYTTFIYKEENEDAPDAEKVIWNAPKRATSLFDMKNKEEIWSEKYETVFMMVNNFSSNGSNGGVFFDEGGENSSWAMSIIPTDIPFIEETGVTHYSNRSKDDIFIKHILKNLNNDSRIRVMDYLAKVTKTPMFLITPENDLQFFGPEMYEVDGVFYSNLEHEDFLSYEQKNFLSRAVAWEEIKNKKEVNLKSLIKECENRPHRILIQAMKKLIPNIGDYIKHLS